MYCILLVYLYLYCCQGKMSDIKALLAIAQEAGLTGESLAAFLREERAAAREAAAAEREREENNHCLSKYVISHLQQ